MANKGKNDEGKDRIISEEMWDKMHDKATWAQDAVLGMSPQGYLIYCEKNEILSS